MFKAGAWLVAGAVLATAGTAHAQARPAAPAVNPVTEQQALQSATPWYLRFTTSTGVAESITGERENDRVAAPSWNLNQHWGVTVDVREAQRIERLPDGGHGDQASVGAFYQFTPSLRVGGQLNLEATRQDPALPGAQQDQPRADVRVESAFRF